MSDCPFPLCQEEITNGDKTRHYDGAGRFIGATYEHHEPGRVMTTEKGTDR